MLLLLLLLVYYYRYLEYYGYLETGRLPYI